MSSPESGLRGRIPPHNLEAERAVLGALMLDPDRIPDVAERLRAEDFHDRRHRSLFEACLLLADKNQSVDLLSLATFLKAVDRLGDVGGNAYLAQIAGAVSSAAHLRHHAGMVGETAMLRRLIGEASGIIDEAYSTPPDEVSVREVVDRAEQRVFAVGSSRERGGATALTDVMGEVFKSLDARSHRRELSGVASGFYALDEMLGGFNPGELTIIAARPSMGKTAFALNLMDHAAAHRPEGLDHDPVVLFFSLEMGRLSIVQRMLCARARVDAHKLRTGKVPNEDYADLAQAAGELQGARLFIDDTPGLSIMAVRSRARRVKHNHGLDLVVIDYLQLMTAYKVESRQQEISVISRSMKELARELEVPVLCLSQLSRAVETREKKRPQLSDLRESGAIEQDADVVLMLYREEYYEPRPGENDGKAEVICAKHRNGPTGVVELRFEGRILRFQNPEPSMAEAILP